MQANRSMFPLPSRMINREREIDAITAALDSPHGQVIYLDGAGGIGKTRILLEVQRRVQDRPRLLSTDIIDLYHGDYHQALFIMDAIVKRLRDSLKRAGEQQAFFTQYNQAAERYRRASIAGNPQSRAEVDQAFIKDYGELTDQYSVVLLIDTFEKLHPVIEGAEQFNFQPASRLEEWLIELVSQLENTVTILAGRPRPKQLDLLQAQIGTHLSVFHIQPFSMDDTTEYVRDSGVELPDDIDQQELFQTLHTASGGRPVILGLALASAKMKGFDISALPANFKEPFPANSQVFIDLLRKHLQEERPELANLLKHALYLRKGLNPAFLAYIPWSDEYQDTQQKLDEFSELPFVKRTNDENRLITLHDEVYEFLFGKLEAEYQLYRQAMEYLEQQIEQIAKSADKESPEQIQRRQSLQVEHLFYHLSSNQLTGYQKYRELRYHAIRARDEDFDTQLRDELARFFEQGTTWGNHYRGALRLLGMSWEYLAFDEGVRWVYRQIEKDLPGQKGSQYGAAIALADQVKQSYPAIYSTDALARCALVTVQLSAETYASPRESAVILRDLEDVTRELEQLAAQYSENLAQTTNQINWRYATATLASAYNRWGYLERKLQHLSNAVEKYKRAVRLFKQLGTHFDGLRAISLNNMGFALYQQGFLERGLEFVEQAARLAVAQGSEYRYAISLNTMAQIKNELNRPDEALNDVLHARRIFEEVRSVRDLALCAKAEGDVRRWLAYRGRAARQRSQEEYKLAIERYHEAMQSFDSPEVGEKPRRIQVRQALGCAHRSRGKVLFEFREDCSADMEAAQRYLEEAIALVVSPRNSRVTLDLLKAAHRYLEDVPDPVKSTPYNPIMSDLLEDIAVIYINQDRFADAEPWLQKARNHIPDEYEIVEGQGLRRTEMTLQQPVYWLRLGQIEFQYALSSIGAHQLTKGCEQLLRAYAYIQAFSPQAPQLAVLRTVGKQALVLYVVNPQKPEDLRTSIRKPEDLQAGVQKLEDLRAETYWTAQTLRLEDTFNEVDKIFDHAIEDLELL